MWAYQNIFSPMQSGTTDEVLWELADVNIGYWMRNRGFLESWQTENKAPCTEEFEALVNRVSAKIETVQLDRMTVADTNL